jgi:hypothetical protein
MAINEKYAQLDAASVSNARQALTEAEATLLAGERPLGNLQGFGIGVKWKGGQPTKEPALVALVSSKVAKDSLDPRDIVPPSFAGLQTDVLAVGVLLAGRDPEYEVRRFPRSPIVAGYQPDEAPLIGQVDTDIQKLAKRVRPAKGGYSVGHYQITAGTLGTSAYDLLPGAKISPPEHGIGTPSKYYILSNNHVLANSNAARIGDPILQPGPYDGGTNPADQIATLSRYVPINFAGADNLIDAAIAEAEFHDIDREIYWSGPVRGWRPKSRVTVGTLVKKTGRTTNFTIGRITAVNATVVVGYGGGKTAKFVDQIVTTSISAGGDSGSLVTTLDGVALGLLFAGSPTATIANQIEHVRSLLRVEVAEQLA